MKTLILTNSYDGTSDALIRHIGTENVFRLNFDQFNNTNLEIRGENILIGNSIFQIRGEDISKVYWRKPFHASINVDRYVYSEIKYIFREIFNLFRLQRKAILVVPNIENYCGKMVQMSIAKKYFNVPNWSVTINRPLGKGSCVAKSLSSPLTSSNKVMYTSIVEREALDSQYPWFLQDMIHSEFDITVVYIDGQLFSYKLRRNNKYIDWRKDVNRSTQNWEVFEIHNHISKNIDLYMKDLGLKFGRLDFLKQGDDYFFLEVNPNGQWAWLDLDNQNGLMAEMILQVSPKSESKVVV
jgi:hypothetical protein